MKRRVADAIVRKKVRAVLDLQNGEPLSEEPMLEAINHLVCGGVDLTQLRAAIEWNHSEALIASVYIDELDLDGWVLTKKGINHDRIK
jgi:hypothetical protein